MDGPQMELAPNGTLWHEMGWARNKTGTKWDTRAPNGMGTKWDGHEMARHEMAGTKWVGTKWPGTKWDRPHPRIARRQQRTAPSQILGEDAPA